jgi:hypothetical protein
VLEWWWVVDAGITIEVTRRRVLGLLGRMLRVKTLSALEPGVLASGVRSVMWLRSLCRSTVPSSGYGVRRKWCGNEGRARPVSIGGGSTCTFLRVAGVCCFSSGAENLRGIPGLLGSLNGREAGISEPRSPLGPKASMFLSFMRDCSVISWAMACADRIWSTVLTTGAGGMTDEDLYAGSERCSIIVLCGREKSETLAGRGY